MTDGIVADDHGRTAVKHDGRRSGIAIRDRLEIGIVHQHEAHDGVDHNIDPQPRLLSKAYETFFHLSLPYRHTDQDTSGCHHAKSRELHGIHRALLEEILRPDAASGPHNAG